MTIRSSTGWGGAVGVRDNVHEVSDDEPFVDTGTIEELIEDMKHNDPAGYAIYVREAAQYAHPIPMTGTPLITDAETDKKHRW